MAEYKKIWSFDFDKTICTGGKFPEIGEPVQAVVDYIKGIQDRGELWILNTNRTGQFLKDAKAWLADHGLFPDECNDNLPQMKEFFKENPRKIFANVYIDDLNAGGVYLPPVDGGLDFGSAIRALKLGKKVARRGWNGKGIYLWVVPAATDKKEWCRDKGLLEAFGDKDEIQCNGHIRMYCADGSVTSGWNATQVDMLAEDWMIIE